MDKFWMWLAWLLPERLVYWCSIRLMARATTGEWSHVNTPDCRIVDALDRWDGGPKCGRCQDGTACDCECHTSGKR